MCLTAHNLPPLIHVIRPHHKVDVLHENCCVSGMFTNPALRRLIWWYYMGKNVKYLVTRYPLSLTSSVSDILPKKDCCCVLYSSLVPLANSLTFNSSIITREVRGGGGSL